jgi:hypothetical protein
MAELAPGYAHEIQAVLKDYHWHYREKGIDEMPENDRRVFESLSQPARARIVRMARRAKISVAQMVAELIPLGLEQLTPSSRSSTKSKERETSSADRSSRRKAR